MAGLRVLIVGASIAGPATAFWLAKLGARVTVIERFPELRTGGQAVDIRTVGVAVMRLMEDLEARVRAKSTQEEGVSFVRDNGRPYGVIRTSGDPSQQSIVSEYEIFRGDLSRILYDMTQEEENIKYIFNEQIASLQDKQDGHVRVEFTNTTPASDFDLVVAADGTTSRTRAMAFSSSVRDHMISGNSWTAYFSTSTDLNDGSRIAHGISAVGGRFISVGPDAFESGNRAMLMSIHRRNDTSAMAAFRKASKLGEDALKEHVVSRFRGAGWITDTILDEMMKSQDFYASETARVRVPSLSSGRVVFVGDAGYAPGASGGGTSLALAGAYMLAGELSKHPGSLTAALQGYENQMQPIIKNMESVPAFVSSIMAPQSAWAIWVRNQIFAFIAWTNIADFVTKYLGGAFADSSTFPLPKYESLTSNRSVE